MLRLLLQLILTITTLSVSANSREELFSATEVTALDGLANNCVNDILQDSKGYIWLATYDGLCRYDGYDFITYSSGDMGLDANLTISLAEDHSGNIWIGTTNKGLFCFVRAENRFVNLRDFTNLTSVELVSPRRLTVDSNGSIWSYDSVLKQVSRFDYDSSTLTINEAKCYHADDPNFNLVSTLAITDDEIYLGTRGGIYHYNRSTDNFDLIVSERPLLGVRTITQRGDLLFISCYNDLLTLDLNSGKVEVLKDFSSNLSLLCWQENTIWVASDIGVFTSTYSPLTNQLSEFNKIAKYENKIPQKLIDDRTNGVWVAYQNHGVTRYVANNTPFGFNSRIDAEGYIVQTIQVDNRDRLYLGCRHNGLDVMDSVGAKMQNLALLPPKSNLLSVEYGDDNIYVATNRAIFRLDIDGSKGAEELIQRVNVRNVLSDGDYLWLATYGDGLIRYDLKSGNSTFLTSERSNLPSNIVRNLMVDSQGVMWVATSHGVAMIADRDGDNVMAKAIASEQNHYSIALLEDSRGDIWYGTIGDGLFRVRCDSTYSSGYRVDGFSKSSGLESNIINAIEEDNNGGLWLSTSKGVSLLMVDSEGVKIGNFDNNDGIKVSDFCELSSAKLSDGTILFGGVGGVVYFQPDSFFEDQSSITPVITDFKIDGESIYSHIITDELIGGSVDAAGGVTLRHNQNNIAIKFAGLHYSSTSKYQYQYTLDGVDQRWRTTSASAREVNYSNLKPGDYTLLLRVALRDGRWSETPLKLPIKIEFPIWQRWYAILIYAVVLLLIGFYVIKLYHEQSLRRNAIRQMKFEQEKISEMLDMRTRFFTNVSHEFRTPLTLILSPMQSLMEDERIKSNSDWSESFRTMSHNGESLMRLVNEFLNFTKQESGKLKLQLSNGNIVSLVEGLFAQFKYPADSRSISLKFIAPDESVTLLYDPYLIEQVVYNLTSNAIKNSSAGGVIELRLESDDDSVRFQVVDSGCGIPTELQSNIFKQYFSRSSDNSKQLGGTGIGLYLTKKIIELHGGRVWFESEEGVGSTFYVELPRRVAEFDEDVVASGEVAVESHIDEPSVDVDGLSKPTLLVIDDNAEIVLLLKSLFAGSYKVISAVDGVDGIEVARAEMPDIIISDVMMPRMDGVEMCETLKGDIATSHIPIIMLSAKSSTDDIVAGFRATADGYCPKPFNNRTLMAMVDATFENRRRLASRVTTVVKDAEVDPPSLVDLCDGATTNLDKQFIAKLTKFVEDNIDNSKLNAVEVCDHMGLSPFILNRKLKSLLNMTTNVFMRSVRIRRAAELLRSSRNSVADVTYDVGFNDLKYFRQCFKEEFGVTPQEYKNRYSDSKEV